MLMPPQLPANKDKLRRILSHRAIPGSVAALPCAEVESAKAVRGDAIDINESGGSAMLEGAQVVKTDIAA